jgi:hypothetical protein
MYTRKIVCSNYVVPPRVFYSSQHVSDSTHDFFRLLPLHSLVDSIMQMPLRVLLSRKEKSLLSSIVWILYTYHPGPPSLFNHVLPLRAIYSRGTQSVVCLRFFQVLPQDSESFRSCNAAESAHCFTQKSTHFRYNL